LRSNIYLPDIDWARDCVVQLPRICCNGKEIPLSSDNPTEAEEEPVFDYRSSKDGKVFISWRGKQVTILRGEQARRFLAQVEAGTAEQAQLAMAKITGNFKRGNERVAKEKRRRS
jgi:hypothetical protein